MGPGEPSGRPKDTGVPRIWDLLFWRGSRRFPLLIRCSAEGEGARRAVWEAQRYRFPENLGSVFLEGFGDISFF